MVLIADIDKIVLNFSDNSLTTMNLILGLIVFGIALNLKLTDFTKIYKNPKSFIIGSILQLILLPALTFALVLTIKPVASLALGMLLVAACPGGNISNYITQLANGNSALSIGLSTSSTLLSSFTTPFLFSFYAFQYEPAQALLQQIHLNFFDMLQLIATLVAIPLVLGLLVSHYTPKFAQRLHKAMNWLSLLFFGFFVIVAFYQNSIHFFNWFSYIFYLVASMNALAFALGYGISNIFKLPLQDIKAVTIETGIQNSGLGMILILNFFNGLGGMMLIAAFWGIWHIVVGLALASFWRRN